MEQHAQPRAGMPRVVVTGSSGFIGSAVVRSLALLPAWSVVAGNRAGSAVCGIAGTRLDVMDQALLRDALDGAEAVVHCAVGGRDVTVDGTKRLRDACASAKVRRLVHFSSIAVYGPTTGRVLETSPMLPPGADAGGYAAWKAEAETVLAASPMEIVRLRPTIVYGAGSAIWVHDIARRIRSGRWGTFGAAAAGTCNPVHVNDVAQAAVLALTAPEAAGQAFNIDADTPLTWNDWFTRMATAIGGPALPALSPQTLRQRSLLALPAKACARFVPPLRGLLDKIVLAAPAASEVALYRLAATYPADKARALLGWSPAVSIDEGLAESVRWLRTKGLAA